MQSPVLFVRFETTCPYIATHSLILAHLRTPPAPMHAPTCMVLLAICARICTLCDTLVHGHGKSESLEGWIGR